MTGYSPATFLRLEGVEPQFRALAEHGDSCVADYHCDQDHLFSWAHRCCSEPYCESRRHLGALARRYDRTRAVQTA